MRKLVTLTAAAALAFGFAATNQAQAAGASQEALAYSWDSTVGAVTPIGKVIWVQPANRNKVNVTFVIQGANPDTSYTVGFDIFTVDTTVPLADAPDTFGVPQWPVVPEICGSVGGVSDCAGIYILGTVDTDIDGDGSLHINLKNLPAGTYDLVFWVGDPCCASQLTGTASWGAIPAPITVAIP
jgi:hypothetical protein